MSKIKIMIVEDEWLIAEELEKFIISLGYDVTSIENTGEGAVKRAGEDRPDLVLMDIALKKKMNGIDAAKQIKSRFSIPHIFMTAYANKDLLDQAKITEPFGYLLKPYNEEELKASIEMALYKHKMETKLFESERFINGILESIGEGLIVIDREYRILSANRAFCEQVGMSIDEIKGKRCYEISHHIDKPCHEGGADCAVKKTFETASSHSCIHTHYDKNGTPAYIELASYPLIDKHGELNSVIEITRDISIKRELEAQLHHAKKMETLGQLAGAFAHNFNNILAGINNYAYLIDGETDTEKKKDHVHKIQDAVRRATKLTVDLRSYSRKQLMSPVPIELNSFINRIESLIRKIIPDNIKVSTILLDKEATISADSTQMEQMLIGIATNARDAMPDGGQLTISIELLNIDHEFIDTHGYGKPGMYALISVSDTGTGMDEETRIKIFEPFFTTKDIGQGVGLGLSIAYGIIKQHEGYINVSSEPGAGTEFKIYLPLM